jgi:cell division protease FtsH
VDAAYQRARKILTERKDKLVALAEYLKKEETIEGWQMDAVLNSPDGKVPVPTAEPKPQEAPDARAPQAQPREGRGPELPPGRLDPMPA